MRVKFCTAGFVFDTGTQELCNKWLFPILYQCPEDLSGGPATKNCFLEGVGRISGNLGRISGNRLSPTLFWITARRIAANP